MVNSPHIEVCNKQYSLIQKKICRIKRFKQKFNEFKVLNWHVKSENEKLKCQISLLLEENDKLKGKVRLFRRRTKILVGHNRKLYKLIRFSKLKLWMQKERQLEAMDNTKLNVLVETILSLLETNQFSKVDSIVNEILYDIITNTLSISSCKLNTIQWKGKDELYVLKFRA